MHDAKLCLPLRQTLCLPLFPLTSSPSMASVKFFLLSCSFFYFLYQVHAQTSFLPDSVLLPVTKDISTFQYITQIDYGTSQLPTKLVVDLGSPFLLVDCVSGHVSFKRIIPSCSIQCSMAKAFHLGNNSCFSGTSRPGNHPSTCDIFTENGITRVISRGELAEDIVAVQAVEDGKIIKVDHFLFVCGPTFLLNGLARGAQGVLGLGRSPVSLPSQLAAAFDFHKKFATCLSSSNGFILFRNMGSDSIFSSEISRSLTYTPLVSNPGGNPQEYFINVRSIKINGKRLALGQEGIKGTKISTTVPYTTLESSIYGTFVKAYIKAANGMNMTRVAPLAPFGLCFSSKGIGVTELGAKVPAIELVLQSEMVKWRIHGRNSMVVVSEEMMCLGLLDGGLDSKTSIVIGGFQLEDTFLDFDLATLMLGFSLPLRMRQTSCSDLLLESATLKDSL
ncbi:hypothetical protein P3X46_006085 [Hevea brasiliensis]|uniref:Peptidase A1 domain-containing protein n=1 Tax=Hevea brasiliensis TaxID=3981 RepID=A0ABQ9MRK2_HEVBR|nr:probable aspartic proteinase GIP2 [Hevea brasiliensis]KAJ9182052.1 hypothetical protein P3X46_006085 [Hevea brasiliensis]